MAEDNKGKWVWGITIFIGIVLILTIVLIKLSKPDFPLRDVFLYIGGTVLVAAIILAAYKYLGGKSSEKEITQDKLPSAILFEDAREIALNSLKNKHYADYLELIEDTTEDLGEGVKSTVYTGKFTGTYEPDTFFVIINMHYPHKKKSILRNPSASQVVRAKMLAASHPEKEQSIRTIDNENIITGVRQRITEPVAKNNNEKDDKKEDALTSAKQ